MHQNPGKSTNCKKTSPNCPRIGILSQSVRDQSAIHPKPWQCRHNLLQYWGLWWNCRFKAIQLQPSFAPPHRPPDCNRPRIVCLLLPIPDRGTIDPKMTSINSIKLDCNWIAKLKRIARSDCIKIARIAGQLQQLHAKNPRNSLQSSDSHTHCVAILPPVT